MVTMPGVFTRRRRWLAAHGRERPCLEILSRERARRARGLPPIRAVLPAELEIAAVGGVSEANFAEYAKIGVKTFGLKPQPLQAGHDGGGNSRSRPGNH